MVMTSRHYANQSSVEIRWRSDTGMYRYTCTDFSFAVLADSCVRVMGPQTLSNLSLARAGRTFFLSLFLSSSSVIPLHLSFVSSRSILSELSFFFFNLCDRRVLVADFRGSEGPATREIAVEVSDA